MAGFACGKKWQPGTAGKTRSIEKNVSVSPVVEKLKCRFIMSMFSKNGTAIAEINRVPRFIDMVVRWLR